jgi:hypothetical protein
VKLRQFSLFEICFDLDFDIDFDIDFDFDFDFLQKNLKLKSM